LLQKKIMERIPAKTKNEDELILAEMKPKSKMTTITNLCLVRLGQRVYVYVCQNRK